MAYPIKSSTLQSSATTTGNGADISGESYIGHRFRVRCSGGTATVVLESSNDGSTYDELESLSMTAGTNEIREITGPHVRLRARISAISGATVNALCEQYYDDVRGASL